MISKPSLLAYRISVFVLAAEWIVFGAAHFTALEATKEQMPGFIPASWHTFVAYATGVIEIATGFMLLNRRTRHFAAWVSLALLVAFVPSIYKMVTHLGPAYFGSATDLMRGLLVPNHIFMALCALYLIRWPDKPERVRDQVREGGVLARHGGPACVPGVAYQHAWTQMSSVPQQDPEILNVGLDLGMEWGPNSLKPIQDRLAERYPELSVQELDAYAATCRTAMTFGYDEVARLWRFSDWASEGPLRSAQAIQERYPWISAENLNHLISQGCYYYWK
jgi:uncharacterized membrane protein